MKKALKILGKICSVLLTDLLPFMLLTWAFTLDSVTCGVVGALLLQIRILRSDLQIEDLRHEVEELRGYDGHE